VAFMLEHYFWLLEFKFKFEFHCLNPFQTQSQKYLNPIPKTPTLFPIQPIRPRSPTPRPAAACSSQLAQQSRSPARPAASTRATAQRRFVAHLAQLSRPTAASRSPPPPAVADSGDPPVIPSVPSSPTRTPSRRRLGVHLRHAHAKESARDYLRPPRPLEPQPVP
jgi:hypothetical protein